MTLTDFLISDSRNAWILYPNTNGIYVRKAHHAFDGVGHKCFDIANLNVINQQQGTFTKFVAEAEELVKEHCPRLEGIYIENVIEEYFRAHLLKNGWRMIGSSEAWAPSFFRAFTNPKK